MTTAYRAFSQTCFDSSTPLVQSHPARSFNSSRAADDDSSLIAPTAGNEIDRELGKGRDMDLSKIADLLGQADPNKDFGKKGG